MLKRTQCNGSCEKKDNNYDDNDSAGEDNDFDGTAIRDVTIAIMMISMMMMMILC